jgi:lauroyl/myristoyl acyltransferase
VGYVNLDIAFGEGMTRDEKRRILRRSFQSFALALLDTFWFAQETGERIKTLVRFGPEYERLFRTAAQICVTGHLGNWEVLGMAISMRGYPLMSVAAPLDNPRVDELFNRVRKTTGQLVVSKHGALRALMRRLRDKEKIALVLDQNTKPSDGGLFVDFFGLPAPFSSAAAALALRTHAEIQIGICIPQPDGSYLASLPFEIPVEGDEAALTQHIAKGIEDAVRANPENWLWMYKRWKYVAPGRKREEYPFYAKELV